MDPKIFTPNKTGDLVLIDTELGKKYAFVPHPLPPRDWKFPQDLWPLLAEARESLGRLDGIGRTLRHPELLIAPLRRREAITSSRIEGTYATAQELMLFELNDFHEPKTNKEKTNAWMEVANYTNAIKKGIDGLKTLPFCERLIKEIHKALLTGIRGHGANPGKWRDHQVAIGSNWRYIPPPAKSSDTMSKCLSDLEAYINSENNDFDPLVRSFLVHYQFEAIHPFSDGNGRVGRVLLSLMIAKWCNHVMPWLYLSPFIERHKDEYISGLFNISTCGDWTRWVEFCLRATVEQAKDAINRCEKLGELKDAMLQRVGITGSPRTATIIDMLFSNPIIAPSSLSRILDISYPTAKADIQKLVDLEFLTKIKSVKQNIYVAPQIFNIAYEDINF